MQPTDEQQNAVELFKSGVGLAIKAGAGAGKTSTLKLMAGATYKRGQYVAFNRAIVEEAKSKFPAHVNASTMHSIAYRAKGAQFRARLNGGRVPSWKLAQILDLDSIQIMVGDKPKTLQGSWLASLTMRGIDRFCQSADKEPAGHHVPYVPGIDAVVDGKHQFVNNALVRDHLEPVLLRAWADLQGKQGLLPFNHGVYLKLFELQSPRINADFILFDEAQDAAPVMESIVRQQEHAQLVVVGDENQAIYGFTGAVDALTHFCEDGAAVTTLSQSFRFGQEIADVANVILSELDSDLRMTGTGSSDVAVLNSTLDAVLCRSNAGAVTRLLQMQAAGKPVTLLGGGAEVLLFAKAAAKLQAGETVAHADLSCFDNWAQVTDYVDQDPQGDDLRLLVRLVEDFGVDVIIKALDTQSPSKDATTISTAHKAKGCEWERVQLHSDFAKSDAPEELRLLYVAATRAQRVLDLSLCEPLTDLLERAKGVKS